MNYGYLTFNIEKILADRNISKNQLCKELDIPRSNFNRRNEFARSLML